LPLWQPSYPDRGHQRTDADDVHDPGEIVGQHAERHLGANVFQPLHQEMSRTHPHLDGAEGMLDRLAALVDDYLKRRGWKESPSNRAYMAGLRASVMSIRC